MSRQPWHAAPCRKRCSCGFGVWCWEHTGSLEHSSPISNAVRTCAKRDLRQAQRALGHKRLETTVQHYVLDELQPELTEVLY